MSTTHVEPRRSGLKPTVTEETARIEKALQETDHGIATLMADPGTRLGPILEAQRERLELTAYLRGLRFLQDTLVQEALTR